MNFRHKARSQDYGRTRGILFANRNKGQRDRISETILETKLWHSAKLAEVNRKTKRNFPQQFSTGGSQEMADGLNLVMLVCAAVGSMAFGVLTAYGIFRVGFALMRPRGARVSLKVRTQLAPE